MQLHWTNRASHDLDHIEAYIAEENPIAAIEQVLRILTVVETHLIEHPLMGRGGREKGTKELVIDKTPYVVVYRVIKNTIEILHVDHDRQRQ